MRCTVVHLLWPKSSLACRVVFIKLKQTDVKPSKFGLSAQLVEELIRASPGWLSYNRHECIFVHAVVYVFVHVPGPYQLLDSFHVSCLHCRRG